MVIAGIDLQVEEEQRQQKEADRKASHAVHRKGR